MITKFKTKTRTLQFTWPTCFARVWWWDGKRLCRAGPCVADRPDKTPPSACRPPPQLLCDEPLRLSALARISCGSGYSRDTFTWDPYFQRWVKPRAQLPFRAIHQGRYRASVNGFCPSLFSPTRFWSREEFVIDSSSHTVHSHEYRA